MKRRVNSDVVVIIPTLNEEEGIGPTLRELINVLGDPVLLMVDGNSVDSTAKIAKDLGVEVILQKGIGKGAAIAEVLEHLNDNIRYIVLTDADYTYPARYIPKMIKILEDNTDYGMVIGNRFNHQFNFKDSINNRFYLGNRFLALTQHLLSGVDIHDPLSGLRVIRGNLLRRWRPRSRSFDIEAELNFFIEKSGYHVAEIPISYRSRLGEKKLKLRHGLVILRRILIESISYFF